MAGNDLTSHLRSLVVEWKECFVAGADHKAANQLGAVMEMEMGEGGVMGLALGYFEDEVC